MITVIHGDYSDKPGYRNLKRLQRYYFESHCHPDPERSLFVILTLNEVKGKDLKVIK